MRISAPLILFIVLLLTLAARSQRPDRNPVENLSEIGPGDNMDERIKKNFFLKADISKKECYVGEPIMASFKAYSRLNANSRVTKRPALTGFSVMEMVDAYSNDAEIEKLNGKYYFSHLIRKVQLFPLQPGTFVLEPAEVESEIYFTRKGENTIRRLSDFFRRRVQDSSLVRNLVLHTPPLTITVKPLPEKSQPEDFSGAVGEFSLQLQMKEKNLHQYEPAIVQLMVMGTGNFPLVTDPEIKWPAGTEASAPQVTEDVNKYMYPLSGIKTFQYLLYMRDTGAFTIPPVAFSYFSPAAKSYKILYTEPLHYTVSPGAKKKDPIQIISDGKKVPMHYYYFGIIAAVIVTGIIIQVLRSRKKE